MKKLLTLLAVVSLVQFVGGCMFMPARTYDGSESFTNAMPQYDNRPSYMQDDPQPLDGK
jgi:hypothetical protein